MGVEVKHINEIMAELMDRKRTFVTSSEASGVAALLDIFCKEKGCWLYSSRATLFAKRRGR